MTPDSRNPHPAGGPAGDHVSGAAGPPVGEHADCREALDRLYTFLDGELTESRRHDIQHHLDTCSPCLEAFDFEADLKLMVARHCRDEVPEQLRIRVAMALREASGTFHGSEDGAGTHQQPF
jgi:mycothiol system anti-sigma-R factor